MCSLNVALFPSQVLLTATPFRSDRSNLPMVVVMGQEDDLKISQRITQGLSSNVAYAPVPINSVEVAEAVRRGPEVIVVPSPDNWLMHIANKALRQMSMCASHPIGARVDGGNSQPRQGAAV